MQVYIHIDEYILKSKNRV